MYGLNIEFLLSTCILYNFRDSMECGLKLNEFNFQRVCVSVCVVKWQSLPHLPQGIVYNNLGPKAV